MLEPVGTVTAKYRVYSARNRPVIPIRPRGFSFDTFSWYDNRHKVDLAEYPFPYRLSDRIGINRFTFNFLFVTPEWCCSEENSPCGGESF